MRLPAVLFPAALILAAPQFSRSESLASKNKKGNILFDQGKYKEAERAYLDAQVGSPGRPEIIYNLGNSLIMQQKYSEGIQALGQSIEKGDKGIKEKGWYNTGNALFSAGNYGEAADAFIRALKLNPSDRDAKHNLELALEKLKEQEQKEKPGRNRRQPNAKDSMDSDKNRASTGGDLAKQPGKEKNSLNGRKEQASRSGRPEGSIDRERAIQLLDALQSQELEEQRKLLEKRTRQRANGRDW